MKVRLAHPLFILALRLVLGMVFITASIEKAADPAAFAVSIGNYKLVSASVALVGATIIPWLELLVGFSFLFGTGVRGSSLLASGMLLLFIAAVASALLRGLDISCGCFTQDPAAGAMGWGKLLENSLLLLASAITYFFSGREFSLSSPPRQSAVTP